MEIDQTEKTMTTKEIAEALGIPSRTIRDIAKRLFPEMSEKGKTTRFTKEQCFSIACSAQPGKHGNDVRQVRQVDYEQLAATIAKAVVLAIMDTMPIQQQKQIAAPMMSLRDTYRKSINLASQRTGVPQPELYGIVANQLYYTKHVNIRVKASNSGTSMIDIIEQEGLFPDAIAIADEM